MKYQTKSFWRLGVSLGTAVCFLTILAVILIPSVSAAAPQVPDAATTSILLSGIAINEVLPDPNSGTLNFDTDNNGTADTLDEFVEIHNLSGSTIDIGGLELWDDGGGNWFTFPNPTNLGPGNYAFVIVGVQSGGSLPTLTAGNLAFDAGLGGGVINNGGDNVVLYDPTNDEYIQLLYNGDAADDPTITYAGFSATAARVGSIEDWGSDQDGASLVRELAGDTNVVQHHTISPDNASPGEPTSLFSTELTVAKSVYPATNVQYQENVTYTVILDNSGEISDTNVIFTDSLPISTTFDSWIEKPAGASVTLNEITWSGTVTSGESVTFTFTAAQTADYGDTITNTAEFSGNTNTGTAQASFTVENDPAIVCIPAPSHRIHDIQGSGAVSPIDGQDVTVNAVVVGDYQVGGFDGFYIQERDENADADPATSEGVFVYYPAFTVDVSVGDTVYIEGTVDEYGDQTQIGFVDEVVICSTGATVTPATVNMPVTAIDDLEAYEGMATLFPDELTVTDNYDMGRYGNVILSSSGRQYQFTSQNLPDVAGYAAHQADIALNSILLDDGRTDSNPLVPMPYLDANGTLRAGSYITNMVGVLGEAFGSYRIQPAQTYSFTVANPRENVTDVGGDLKIASFNVLNYFTTIDDSGSICGPNENLGCRGADTPEELVRQRDKLVNAILGLDADVVGLIEIENHIDDDALIDLVNSLNAVMGAGTYDYLSTGPIGTDAIKVAFIFQPTSTITVGNHAILDDSFDPGYQDDRNRPALAQTFAPVGSTTGRVTVVINHLKSKGCGGATGLDEDQLDGQGCWNAARTQAAGILADWLATDPTSSNSDNFLIMGDLNSYGMEDPISSLESDGYLDLMKDAFGDEAYSYSFNGEFGHLDYALASPLLQPSINDTTVWHINSDEPRALDYNDFNQDYFYNPDQYRASDHDPVVVGINFTPTLSILTPMDNEVFTSLDGNDVTVPVVVTTTNFTIPTDGHWHIWVDGVHLGPVMDYDTTVDLSIGNHVISAELNSPSHTPLGVIDTVAISVEEPSVTILTPVDGTVITTTNGAAAAVPITITATNFVIPTDGHWHLWVDGVNTGPVMGYTATVDLLPGAHVITAELNTPAHQPLGVVDSVSVTINTEYMVILPIIMKP